MAGDYELKDYNIHPCKVIALVHLGYYHLSCIIHYLVFKSKNCIYFENSSTSIKLKLYNPKMCFNETSKV